jgi:hypothetical protein
MSGPIKQSRLGFVVIKLLLDGESHLLMRKNLTWNDISFIGGHEEPRDGGSLLRTARRELLEEVPALRSSRAWDLLAISENLSLGPVYSQSAACDVQYTMSFFMLCFHSSPHQMLESIGGRSLNVLARTRDLADGNKYRVSKLFEQLNNSYPGGVESIPYSWADDLGASVRNSGGSVLSQREFALR